MLYMFHCVPSEKQILTLASYILHLFNKCIPFQYGYHIALDLNWNWKSSSMTPSSTFISEGFPVNARYSAR